MSKKATLFALLFSAVLLTACSTGGGTTVSSGELPDVIKIGVLAPLTGNAGSYGQDMKSGTELYFAENPTIGDSTVELIIEDGKCNGQDAANAAQKLINIDKVKIIIGGVCSGETLAMAPIAEQNQVLVFSPGSSSPEITTAGDYIFRNYPSDDNVAKTLVEDVLANHEVVALLSEQTDYAQGYRGAVNKHMAAAGQELVLDEAFAVDNTDYRTLLTKVDESGADVLIFVGQTPVVGGFVVKQVKELGLDIQIYGTDTFPGVDFFDTAKDAAEGVKAVYVSEDKSRSGAQGVLDRIGDAQAAEIFPLLGYDAAEIIAGAIAAVGYDATAIKDYLYDMPTFKGVAVDVTLDENGDNNAPAAVKIVKDGEFVFAN